MKIKRILTITTFLVFLFSSVLLCDTAMAIMAADESFPSFTSQTLYGKPVTEDIFSGKKLTMVNFWATWCGPCRWEMPYLGKLEDKLPEGTQLVGILRDWDFPGALEDAKEIMADSDANYVQILVTNEIESHISSDPFPTTYFVDGNGKIVGPRLTGARTDGDYLSAINYILQGTVSDGNPITMPTGISGGVVEIDNLNAEKGEAVTFSVIPDSGCVLELVYVHKTGDTNTTVPLHINGNNCEFIMPEYPVTIAASFKAADDAGYTITMPTNVTGGVLTLWRKRAAAGETVTFYYDAARGYTLESIYVYKTGDTSVNVQAFCTETTCEFVMPAYPVTVVVSFKAADNAADDAADDAGYTITMPSNVTGGTLMLERTTAKEGETVTFYYSPHSGYTLDSIYVHKTGNTSTIVPSLCTEITCEFVMPAYPVTIVASFKAANGGGYVITTSSNITGGELALGKTAAKAGETVTFYYYPYSGYTLETISAHKTGDTSVNVQLYFTDNIGEFTMPPYPVTIRASFKVKENISSNSVNTGGEGGGGGCAASTFGPALLLIAAGSVLARRKRP